MSRGPLHVTVAATVAGNIQTVALMRRLRTELTETGRLSAPSVVWMDATYGAHAAATGVALARQSGHLPLSRPVSVVGGLVAVAGAGMAVAGMARFAGPRQPTAT